MSFFTEKSRKLWSQTLQTILIGLVVASLGFVTGCDSGGSNEGGEKSGSITAKVEGGDATGSLDVQFTYAIDGETCSKFAFDQSFEAPGEKEFDPTVIPAAGDCSVDSPNEWDKVEVTFSPDGSADGLSLTLTSGGSEIASTSSPNSSGNLVATVGSVDGS